MRLCDVISKWCCGRRHPSWLALAKRTVSANYAELYITPKQAVSSMFCNRWFLALYFLLAEPPNYFQRRFLQGLVRARGCSDTGDSNYSSFLVETKISPASLTTQLSCNQNTVSKRQAAKNNVHGPPPCLHLATLTQSIDGGKQRFSLAPYITPPGC